jgi:PKD repeat protein
LPRSVFKFSLNNTGVETVSLFRPDGSVASTVSYADAKEDASYSFNGNAFRFSSHLTPGAENQFSKEPKIHIESKKQGFVNLPLIFQANLTRKYKKKSSTFVWNFGDGKTSRLATPKHTYTKTGRYPVTVTIKNKTVEASKTFNVSINSYPKTPVIITRLLPNPKGKDADSEWIEVQNLSPKSVALKDWKIATGSDAENLSNHTFTKDILLSAKSTHKITGLENTFSLNNTASLIELRYPSGEAASLVKYEEENIPEDAVCENKENLCDFVDTDKKTDETEEEGQVLRTSITDSKEVPTDTGENQVAQVFPLTEKQVLQNRIKQDTNALINLYLRAWISR